MTVNISKPAINVREKLNELDKPTGIAGEAMLRAETPQEQFNLIGAGRRNLLYNGAMQVAQRGTTFDHDSYTGSKKYTLDRYYMQGVVPSSNNTVSQSTDAPSGFHFSLKVTQDSAASSYPSSSSQHYRIRQSIEGYDCAVAENKPCVLSFWVKSSITGQFDVALFAPDNTYNHMVVPYTIDAANTWEKKELRFIGPPNIDCNNTTGLDIQFQLARSGSNYRTNATGVWGSTKLSSSDSTDAFIKTAGATFQITGVQLELGKVATPFEHRSYGEELALCQRFFCRPINNVNEDGNSNVHSAIGVGRGAGGGAVVVWSLLTPVPMRDRPAITSSGSYYLTDSTSRTAGSPTAVTISQFTVNSSNLLANYTFSSSVCDDDRVVMVGAHTAVKIDLDAEL